MTPLEEEGEEEEEEVLVMAQVWSDKALAPAMPVRESLTIRLT
jgi:hypothetical protein